jgi:hypothetical protein
MLRARYRPHSFHINAVIRDSEFTLKGRRRWRLEGRFQNNGGG